MENYVCPREYKSLTKELVEELHIHSTAGSLRREVATCAFTKVVKVEGMPDLLYAKHHKDTFTKEVDVEGTDGKKSMETQVDEELENKDWTIHAIDHELIRFLLMNAVGASSEEGEKDPETSEIPDTPVEGEGA